MSESRAGWYPDPSGDQSKLRYWDGEKWTDDFADSPSAAQDACNAGADAGAGNAYVPPAPQPAAYQQTTTRVVSSRSEDGTLRLIAFIFCIISTVCSSWLIVPLAWMIPMSVVCWGIYKGTRPNTTAFGVCTLLFVSIVAGILLLVSKKDQ